VETWAGCQRVTTAEAEARRGSCKPHDLAGTIPAMRLEGAWRDERRARLQKWAVATLVVHALTVVYVLVRFGMGSDAPDAAGEEGATPWRLALLVASGVLGMVESWSTRSRLRRAETTAVEERWLVMRNRVLLLTQCGLVIGA
jgi:hypothetical protein